MEAITELLIKLRDERDYIETIPGRMGSGEKVAARSPKERELLNQAIKTMEAVEQMISVEKIQKAIQPYMYYDKDSFGKQKLYFISGWKIKDIAQAIYDDCLPAFAKLIMEIDRLRRLIRCEKIEPPSDVTDDISTNLAVKLAYCEYELTEENLALKQENEKLKAELKWWHDLIHKHHDNKTCSNLKTYVENLARNNEELKREVKGLKAEHITNAEIEAQLSAKAIAEGDPKNKDLQIYRLQKENKRLSWQLEQLKKVSGEKK